ncbi:DUF4432 family protein [Bosea sp. (in: a-proteobacteria)]|uniref:DUF4432 family protein n=1 Tax=Bosea sp. (in: a-proteobacteria) TaxID=1871050 RepID=UPI002DDD621F|nr:DUF4432 family protein [Bosea sp. (in: a-proteobacteria)]HEV2508333.1 DUF4432 family protein [Bosea sp. (in: a-proteobacteria)]
MLTLENERLRVSFAVGRGADLVEFLHKPTDTDFVWLSANGLRHPALRAVTPPDARMAFYDSYPGGWQEVFPAGGAPSAGPGLPIGSHGMHGEVWHRPWDWRIVEDAPSAVQVELSVRTETLPYRLIRNVRLESGSPSLLFEEVAINESKVELPLMWGHHITFGRPFLGPGAVIEMPRGVEVVTGDISRSHPQRRLADHRVMPWHDAVDADGRAVEMSLLPEAGTPGEMSYLRGFRDGRYLVRNTRELGLEIAWDAAVMPYVWCWQEFGAMRDYPWFGRHYNIGLEPFTSMPREGLAAAVENGTASSLMAGERKTFWLRATVSCP